MYDIGTLVALKSNPDIKMVVCGRKDNDIVVCTFINRNFKIEKVCYPIGCLDIFEDKKIEMELEKIPLLYCKSEDCYSFFEYASIFGQNVNPNTTSDEKIIKNTRFIYDFKKSYPKNKTKVHNLLTMATHYLECDQIVCIPGHTTELNSLQKVFGLTIERVCEVEPRKYNHKYTFDACYENSYFIDFRKLSNNIMLVDDIITSGITMNHFRNVLVRKGFNVKCLSISINYKLDFNIVNHFWLFK